MSSDHKSGGGASKTKTKHKWSSNHNRSKPMVVSRPERSVPLVSPSNSFASEDDHHMLKISLSSISKLEVRNLKRKLNAELDEVRILIKRLDPPQGGNIGSAAKTGAPGRNKKVKTGNGGGKKGGPGAADKGMVQVFKNCNTLLTKLMKHKCGWVFNVPVDVKGLGLHDYHTIVEQPMDLGSVKTKLEKKLYNSPLDFAEDVRLTFNNAILYNPVGHDVHQFAEVLLAMFEEKWVAIEMQYDNLHRKFKPTRDIEFSAPVSTVAPTVVEPLPAPTPSPSPPPPPPPAPVLDNRNWERDESMTIPVEPETVTTAPEKPEEEEEEAPANNSRDLTLEEKRRLSEELQDLPFDKLEIVVQIIKKSNPELSQQDDEIELDIDSLDINTLWELYRFVTGYKDSLRKKKEQHQGFGSERDAESVHNIIHEPTTLVTGTETSRVTESGKAIRTSSPARQENNASGSSSSNSSSSDSGSGSSDSDSDSSSGRESDTGN
ncbi:PREDICTED: transcription factor GTE5, chloroplastic-like [Camelina sativa]|uniref:Transcription factor GTE5, chloroplastic-like n=1 Tax=Camelina sativa TaxID=90675 RepID=A0ABM1QVM9_CAMSA|nr:PREDICTED: transcription factor GTE5, chloroplastic-like [Camelina sativa]